MPGSIRSSSHQVRQKRTARRKSRVAVSRPFRLESVNGQVVAQQLGDAGVVFHNQDAFGHVLTRGRSESKDGGRPDAKSALNAELAAVAVGDATRDREAQAAAVRVGRRPRRESAMRALQILRRYALAVIDDRKLDVRTRDTPFDRQRVRPRVAHGVVDEVVQGQDQGREVASD